MGASLVDTRSTATASPGPAADAEFLSDRRYYQVATPHSFAERLTKVARDRIYADFRRFCRPTEQTRILDVGVSSVACDAANVLERRYPYPERITAAGLDTGAAFRAAHPCIAYRQIEPNAALPFADGAFDIATSNAVLEHVGSPHNQAHFITELCRVARHVFVTVPNRGFPVEHHTGIPLIHWTDTGFAWGTRQIGRAEWSRAENLILMSRRRLQSLCPPGRKATVGYTGILLGPLSANLFLDLPPA